MKWTVLADTTTTTPADITTDITAKSSGKQVNNKEPRRIKKRPVKSDNNNINNKQKRQKVGKILSVNDLDDLEWNNIPFCESTPFTEDSAGGYTMLEEIDDVEVIYEKNERGGNTVKFRVIFILYATLSINTVI